MKILIWFIVLIVVLTAVKFYGIYKDYGINEQKNVNIALLVSESIPVVLITTVFLILIFFLRKFYKYDYLSNRKIMIVFLLSELAVMSIMISYHYVTGPKIFNVITRLETIFRIFGFYPIQQAICIILIKATQDPLVGISKLEYLQIVQYFQR